MAILIFSPTVLESLITREYFNSAGDSTYHDMALVRYCLDVIKEPVDEIISEHCLIEAIGILGSCKVSIIPVQVRLCEHK